MPTGGFDHSLLWCGAVATRGDGEGGGGLRLPIVFVSWVTFVFFIQLTDPWTSAVPLPVPVAWFCWSRSWRVFPDGARASRPVQLPRRNSFRSPRTVPMRIAHLSARTKTGFFCPVHGPAQNEDQFAEAIVGNDGCSSIFEATRRELSRSLTGVVRYCRLYISAPYHRWCEDWWGHQPFLLLIDENRSPA